MHTLTEAPTPPLSRSSHRPNGLSIRVSWGDRRVSTTLLSASRPRAEVGGSDEVPLAARRLRFEWTARGALITFGPGLRGELLRNGEHPLSLSDTVARGLATEAADGWTLSLGALDAMRFDAGPLTVEAIPVHVPKRLRMGLDEVLDYRWLNVLLVTALVASGLLTSLSLWEPDLESGDDAAPSPVVIRHITPAQTPPPEPMQRVERNQAEPIDRRLTQPSRRPAPRPAPPTRAPGAPERVAVNVNELFRGAAGRGLLGDAAGLNDALKGLAPTGVATAGGLGGLNLRGGGGGGGEGQGPVGIGAIALRGPGRGPGALHKDRGPALPAPTMDEPVFCAEGSGCLDKETIRRVIREHMKEVRFCYSESLQTMPTLAGREVVRFHIAASGGVDSVTITQSLASRTLDDCLASRVSAWRFPTSKAVGGAIVSYPFVFSMAGTEP